MFKKKSYTWGDFLGWDFFSATNNDLLFSDTKIFCEHNLTDDFTMVY